MILQICDLSIAVFMTKIEMVRLDTHAERICSLLDNSAEAFSYAYIYI
jgi:hypothetical protein